MCSWQLDHNALALVGHLSRAIFSSTDMRQMNCAIKPYRHDVKCFYSNRRSEIYSFYDYANVALIYIIDPSFFLNYSSTTGMEPFQDT